MSSGSGGPPAEVVEAAERLFAERGIEAVSLREINRAAGQRNSSALQYHFGGHPSGTRAGLLAAVLSKHRGVVERERHELLDRYEAVPPVDHADAVRLLTAALVEPLAGKLADPDGGRAYLRIVAELADRPDPRFDRSRLVDDADSTNRWRHLVEPLLDEAAVSVFHVRFSAIRLAHGELARRAAGRPRRDDRLFVSRTVDLVAAVLDAPVSEQTRDLLRAPRPTSTSGPGPGPEPARGN